MVEKELEDILTFIPTQAEEAEVASTRIQAIIKGVITRNHFAMGIGHRKDIVKRMTAKRGILFKGKHPLLVSVRPSWLGNISSILIFDVETNHLTKFKLKSPFAPIREAGTPRKLKLNMVCRIKGDGEDEKIQIFLRFIDELTGEFMMRKFQLKEVGDWTYELDELSLTSCPSKTFQPAIVSIPEIGDEDDGSIASSPEPVVKCSKSLAKGNAVQSSSDHQEILSCDDCQNNKVEKDDIGSFRGSVGGSVYTNSVADSLSLEEEDESSIAIFTNINCTEVMRNGFQWRKEFFLMRIVNVADITQITLLHTRTDIKLVFILPREHIDRTTGVRRICKCLMKICEENQLISALIEDVSSSSLMKIKADNPALVLSRFYCYVNYFERYRGAVVAVVEKDRKPIIGSGFELSQYFSMDDGENGHIVDIFAEENAHLAPTDIAKLQSPTPHNYRTQQINDFLGGNVSVSAPLQLIPTCGFSSEGGLDQPGSNFSRKLTELKENIDEQRTTEENLETGSKPSLATSMDTSPDNFLNGVEDGKLSENDGKPSSVTFATTNEVIEVHRLPDECYEVPATEEPHTAAVEQPVQVLSKEAGKDSDHRKIDEQTTRVSKPVKMVANALDCTVEREIEGKEPKNIFDATIGLAAGVEKMSINGPNDSESLKVQKKIDSPTENKPIEHSGVNNIVVAAVEDCGITIESKSVEAPKRKICNAVDEMKVTAEVKRDTEVKETDELFSDPEASIANQALASNCVEEMGSGPTELVSRTEETTSALEKQTSKVAITLNLTVDEVTAPTRVVANSFISGGEAVTVLEKELEDTANPRTNNQSHSKLNISECDDTASKSINHPEECSQNPEIAELRRDVLFEKDSTKSSTVLESKETVKASFAGHGRNAVSPNAVQKVDLAESSKHISSVNDAVPFYPYIENQGIAALPEKVNLEQFEIAEDSLLNPSVEDSIEMSVEEELSAEEIQKMDQSIGSLLEDYAETDIFSEKGDSSEAEEDIAVDEVDRHHEQPITTRFPTVGIALDNSSRNEENSIRGTAMSANNYTVEQSWSSKKFNELSIQSKIPISQRNFNFPPTKSESLATIAASKTISGEASFEVPNYRVVKIVSKDSASLQEFPTQRAAKSPLLLSNQEVAAKHNIKIQPAKVFLKKTSAIGYETTHKSFYLSAKRVADASYFAFEDPEDLKSLLKSIDKIDLPAISLMEPRPFSSNLVGESSTAPSRVGSRAASRANSILVGDVSGSKVRFVSEEKELDELFASRPSTTGRKSRPATSGDRRGTRPNTANSTGTRPGTSHKAEAAALSSLAASFASSSQGLDRDSLFQRSVEHYKNTGYLSEQRLEYTAHWHELVSKFLSGFESAIPLRKKVRILLKAAPEELTIEEAVAALAGADGSVGDVCQRLNGLEFHSEIKLVCFSIPIKRMICAIPGGIEFLQTESFQSRAERGICSRSVNIMEYSFSSLKSELDKKLYRKMKPSYVPQPPSLYDVPELVEDLVWSDRDKRILTTPALFNSVYQSRMKRETMVIQERPATAPTISKDLLYAPIVETTAAEEMDEENADSNSVAEVIAAAESAAFRLGLRKPSEISQELKVVASLPDIRKQTTGTIPPPNIFQRDDAEPARARTGDISGNTNSKGAARSTISKGQRRSIVRYPRATMMKPVFAKVDTNRVAYTPEERSPVLNSSSRVSQSIDELREQFSGLTNNQNPSFRSVRSNSDVDEDTRWFDNGVEVENPAELALDEENEEYLPFAKQPEPILDNYIEDEPLWLNARSSYAESVNQRFRNSVMATDLSPLFEENQAPTRRTSATDYRASVSEMHALADSHSHAGQKTPRGRSVRLDAIVNAKFNEYGHSSPPRTPTGAGIQAMRNSIGSAGGNIHMIITRNEAIRQQKEATLLRSNNKKIRQSVELIRAKRERGKSNSSRKTSL